MLYRTGAYIGIAISFFLAFSGGLKDVKLRDGRLNISKYHYWHDSIFVLLVVVILLLFSIDDKLTK